MNCEHQNAGKQVMRSNQKRVFQHGAGRVFYTGQQRKDIEQNNHINNRGSDDDCHQQCPHHSRCSGRVGAEVVENVPISGEKNSESQQDEPDDCRLFEILFEGVEEHFPSIIPFFPYDLETGVIKGGRGGPDGDDR